MKKSLPPEGQQQGVGRSGSGVPGGDGGATGHVTGAADSLAEPVDGEWLNSDDSLVAAEDLEDFTVSTPGDPSLGLTGVEGHPPEDWAANTGPDKNPDANDVDVAQPHDPPNPECPPGANRKGPKRKRP
jgi:hypothetical protein